MGIDESLEDGRDVLTDALRTEWRLHLAYQIQHDLARRLRGLGLPLPPS